MGAFALDTEDEFKATLASRTAVRNNDALVPSANGSVALIKLIADRSFDRKMELLLAFPADSNFAMSNVALS